MSSVIQGSTQGNPERHTLVNEEPTTYTETIVSGLDLQSEHPNESKVEKGKKWNPFSFLTNLLRAVSLGQY